VTLGNEVIRLPPQGPPPLQRQDRSRIRRFDGRCIRLFARFESKLEQFNGNLPRSVVELAKDGAPTACCATLKPAVGRGSDDHLPGERQRRRHRARRSIAAIGSGGPFALAAALALARNTKLSAKHIASRPC